MADPIFGLVVRTVDNEPRPVLAADLSTIGLVGPASGADASVFPLDTPIKLYSNDNAKVAKLGTTEYLADAIRGINDQLAQLQAAAQIVVVRTASPTGADDAAKLKSALTGIVGSSTAGTGLWALLDAPEEVSATPRIVIVPGYTSQLVGTVGTVTIGTQGTGYTPNAQIPATFAGGGSGAILPKGYGQVDGTGKITSFVVTDPGLFLSANPTLTFPAPTSGTTALATATYAVNASPVCVTLPPVLSQLLGHAVVESAGIDQATDEAWRETLSSTRLIPVVGGVKVMDPVSGTVVTRPFAPRVAGLLVRRDHEKGAPFHSAANQQVYGIVGPARPVRFSLTSDGNEGQSLLAANMGILVRGEIGSDFAISSGGFVFIGTDNAGEDELWRFYNQTRGRDFIHISLLRALRFYLGRYNLTGQTVEAVLNTVKFFLRDLQADRHIIGYKVGFNGSQNSAEQIRLGHLTIAFAAEEPAPLRKITTESSRYRPAIDAMVADLESQLNLAA